MVDEGRTDEGDIEEIWDISEIESQDGREAKNSDVYGKGKGRDWCCNPAGDF